MPTMYDFFDPTNPKHLRALKSGPVGPSWRYLAAIIDPSGLIGAESSYVAYTEAVSFLADHCLAQIEQNADDLTAAYNVGRADEREKGKPHAEPVGINVGKVYESLEEQWLEAPIKPLPGGHVEINETMLLKALTRAGFIFPEEAKPQPQPDGESVAKFRAVVFEPPYGGTAIYGDDTSESDDDFDDMLTYLSDKVIGDPIEPRAILNIRVPAPQVPTIEVEAEVEESDV